MAAGGHAFVGRALGVGSDQVDVGRRDGEFVRGDLDERGFQSLAELGLAGEDRGTTVGVDADPGIEERIFVEVARQATLLLLRRSVPGNGEGYDQRALAKQLAAGERVHVRSSFTPPPIATAARRTAARMRICVPQRQRLGAMCWRSSLSVGVVVRDSSACARMIMPAMQ